MLRGGMRDRVPGYKRVVGADVAGGIAVGVAAGKPADAAAGSIPARECMVD